MFGKKTLRLATAALMVGVAMGAQQALPRQAHAAGETGIVTISDWQFPDGCGNPGGTVVDAEVCNPMLRGLFDTNTKSQYYADLAESIPTIGNGGAKVVNGDLVVTYKLKPNLKWSDGSPLTASDCVFGVKLELAAGNTVGFDQIKDMKVVDARTMVFTYKGSYASYYEAAPPVPWPQAYLQKKYGTVDLTALAPKWAADPYNSPNDLWNGPYKLSSYTANQGLVEVPNPYYNAQPAAPGHPRPAQIKFVVISSSPASFAADLLSANSGVDKAEDFQEDDVATLQRGKMHLTVQPALTFEHLELNTSGVLKDVRLRQALLYAVDKTSYYHQLFPAISDPQSHLTHGPFPNSLTLWADPHLPTNQYNVSKAKALLKAAGYSTDYNGSGRHLFLHFATTNKPVRQRSFEILAKYWAAVGIHVSPIFPNGSGYGGLFSDYTQNGVLQQGRFDITEFAWEVSPDPTSLESFFDPTNIPSATKHGAPIDNYARFTDASKFSLLVKARTTLDNKQRYALLDQFQKYVMAQSVWIMLYDRSNITVDDGTIGNYKPNPTSSGNEWNTYQWYKAGAQ